ncbi:MAG: hypothetical protein Fur0010_06420 [Bdellovibrio sp.]
MSGQAFGFVSSQTTVSGGAYRDYTDRVHFVSILDWQLQAIGSHGTEFYLDLGINNNLIQDAWNLYPQQMNALLPISDDLKMRIGRFSMNEAMYFNLYDGAEVSYKINPSLEMKANAGNLTFLEETDELTDDHQLYALSFKYFKPSISIKLGHSLRYQDKNWQQLPYFQWFQKNDGRIPLDFSLDSRFNIEGNKIEKGHTQIHSYFSDNYDVAYFYQIDHPEYSLPLRKNLWFRLTSTTDVESHGVLQNYRYAETLDFSLNLERNDYRSKFREEAGEKVQASMNVRWVEWMFSPSLTWIKSFGGKLISPALEMKRSLSALSRVSLLVEASRYEKINRISGNALLLRSSYQRFWNSDFMSAISMDIERNHYYAFDVRGMIYVTHFAY